MRPPVVLTCPCRVWGMYRQNGGREFARNARAGVFGGNADRRVWADTRFASTPVRGYDAGASAVFVMGRVIFGEPTLTCLGAFILMRVTLASPSPALAVGTVVGSETHPRGALLN